MGLRGPRGGKGDRGERAVSRGGGSWAGGGGLGVFRPHGISIPRELVSKAASQAPALNQTCRIQSPQTREPVQQLAGDSRAAEF